MHQDYFVIYFHGTNEVVLQDITSTIVYVGSVGFKNLNQQSNLNNRLDVWKHYLTNRKGVDIRGAQLLTLSINANEVKPLITLKKNGEKWICKLGIPNHYSGDNIIKINGNTVTVYNDSMSYDLPIMINILSGKNARTMMATVCLSPSVFHIALSQEKDKMKCQFAIKDKSQIVLSYIADLPYSHPQLQAINTALEHIELSQIRKSQQDNLVNYKPELGETEKNILISLGYWKNDKLINDFHKQVGRRLYESLFQDSLKSLLKEHFLNRINFRLNLHFNSVDNLLLQCPWELMHNNENFLSATGQINLIRIIGDRESSRPWQVNNVNILFVNPDPVGNLRNKKPIIRRAITSSKKSELINLNKYPVKTWKAFQEKILALKKIDIIHFDGHTQYAKRCNNCFQMNRYDSIRCVFCAADLYSTSPLTFIEFEHKDGEPDLIEIGKLTDTLVHRFQSDSLDLIKLMIFTSCDSARIRNRDVESVIAPALILAGVSSVVAMQGKVLSSSLEVFVKNFYSELLNDKCLVDALSAARIQMIRDEYLPAWFMPVIYGNNSLDGCIFKIPIEE